MKVDGKDVYVWAAVGVETFEIVHVDVSPGRYSLERCSSERSWVDSVASRR